MHNFFIVVTGYNCQDNVLNCYKSLTSQSLPWRAVFVNDASTDNTCAAIMAIDDKRVTPQHQYVNRGAAFGRYLAITNLAKEDDIVLLLGMDDMLLTGALERIAKEYDNGKLMTYGNWLTQNRRYLRPSALYFPDYIHEVRDYRRVPFRSTAPNTFKKYLFNNFTCDDFKVDNKWIKSTTESPLMFGLLEMCGKDRIGVIEEPIYWYNQREDNARNRMDEGYQDYIYYKVTLQPKKNLL